MKRPASDLDPELEAFLTPRRIQRQVPPELRARVLARARATLAGETITPAQPPQPRPVHVAHGRRLFRIALAASVAIAGAAVGAVAALHVRSGELPPVAFPDGVPPAPRVPAPRVDSPAREPSPEPEATKPPHLMRSGAKGDPFTAELELLQRAHGAYTRRDFSGALTLVAEHARRFPRGHLAEQREALRVRSLAGAGRAEEAHRAAAAFAVRFPRSVLLPQVAGGLESPQP